MNNDQKQKNKSITIEAIAIILIGLLGGAAVIEYIILNVVKP